MWRQSVPVIMTRDDSHSRGNREHLEVSKRNWKSATEREWERERNYIIVQIDSILLNQYWDIDYGVDVVILHIWKSF